MLPMHDSGESVLGLARAGMEADEDPEVRRALERVLAHGGDIRAALADLSPAQAQFYGPGARYLESLVTETCKALTGEGEIVAKLEEQRRTLLGNTAVGVGIGAGLVSSTTGLPLAIGTLVFLYLLPIGIRAGCGAWESRSSR
jgi:hypothetical protein